LAAEQVSLLNFFLKTFHLFFQLFVLLSKVLFQICGLSYLLFESLVFQDLPVILLVHPVGLKLLVLIDLWHWFLLLKSLNLLIEQ
jgi:hypothetical protein